MGKFIFGTSPSCRDSDIDLFLASENQVLRMDIGWSVTNTEDWGSVELVTCQTEYP
jgi:hypothetical protein